MLFFVKNSIKIYVFNFIYLFEIFVTNLCFFLSNYNFNYQFYCQEVDLRFLDMAVL